MVVDREVNEEVDQVSKEVKEEVPNLPRRGLVVGPAGCAAVHRQPIHPQILIRIVTATTVHCSAPSSTLHCTSLPCSAQCTLHNALHSTKDVLHCVASNSVLHCWTVWLNSAVLTSQRRRSPPSNANCRSSNFSRCVFSNPPYFLPYLPKAFSALGQSPRNLPSRLKFSTIVTFSPFLSQNKT